MNKFQQIIITTISLLLTMTAVNAETVTAATSDFVRPIPKHFVGFNGMLTTAGGNPWKRRNLLLQCLERSNVKLLRYPGGEVGNYWDFNTGWVSLTADPTLMPKYIAKLRKSTNRYTIADLALAYRITHITPIFDLNIITQSEDQLPSIIKMIHQNSLPLKYFELGSNFFPNNKEAEVDYAKTFPTAKSYAKRAEDWADEIKELDENSKVAIAATLNTSADITERQRRWNSVLDDYDTEADAYAIQFFFKSGIEPMQNSNKSITWGSEEDQTYALRNFYQPMGVETVLAQPYIAWIHDLQNTPVIKDTSKQIWVTEFNLRDPIGVIRHTWAHALAVANAINIFLMDKRVAMANLFNIYSIYPKYTAIFPPNDIFLRLKVKPQLRQANMKTTGWDLTGAGQVMKFFAEAMNGRDRATMLRFDPAPEFTFAGHSYPAVFGWLFTSSTYKLAKPKAIFVNESPHDVWVNLAGIDFGKFRIYMQYSGDPREYVTSEHFLYRFRERLRDKIKLPKYSITVVQ